jgi:hypothetical protein
MAEAPASRFKGKQVEVEILTDTYKIRGILFVPLAGKDGYSARLSDFLNNPEKTFLALTNVCVEVLPDPDMKCILMSNKTSYFFGTFKVIN